MNLNNYSYSYTAGTNKLQSITNSVNSQTKNYDYDKTGNTIKDEKQGVTNGVWNVYGKLQSLTNKDGVKVTYTYDAGGQRISKKAGNVIEYYVKDAGGNTMATYKKDPSINRGHVSTSEYYKYGSSLLSIKNTVADMEVLPANGNIQTQTAGADGYILSDQSGNTRIIVSDRKIQHSSDGITVDYYTADVKNANFYSSYGAISNTLGSSPVLAFNGQRKSTEIGADTQTAEFWEYNGDVGRRWNRDPRSITGFSPYSAFLNNPIYFNDPLGDTTINGQKYEFTNPNHPQVLAEVKITAKSNKESNNLSGIGLSALGFAVAYGDAKMFNNKSWFNLKAGRSYSQKYFGNQYQSAEEIKSAKGLSKNVSRGLKVFGYGIGVWNQVQIFNDKEMSGTQKNIETGSNVISTFGGVYGAAWGIGWEAGRTITQISSYRQNVRPLIQDFLGVTRDEVPKISSEDEKYFQ